jgi:pyruvate/2-oxoglutarate dehydrogenase complex dihydrolipoamide dehydrogenase (E3) component
VRAGDVDHVDGVDLVIVGCGSGGMTAAEFAAKVGKRVVVVERDRVGGDCLWTGCVPSKALIASARVAHHLRHADRMGLPPSPAPIDLGNVWRRVRAVREEIATGDDDPARFRALGVDVLFGDARVTSPTEVTVTAPDGTTTRVIDAPTILLCTGSRPTVPAIPGLAEAGFVTSETIFELDDVPARLVFIGGGPIAIELAQACRRLGIEVTVLQRAPTILTRDEPELVDLLCRQLEAEGVAIHTSVEVTGVEPGPVVVGVIDGGEQRWPTDGIVVAAGRTPNLATLGLDAVRVETDRDGVVVDERMRSTVPSIYAAGDVAGRQLFTHAAAYQAVRALRDAWFPGKGTANALIPWATFTDPELAHAGLTAAEATQRFGATQTVVHRWSLEHNDRAHADGSTGAIVLVEHRRRRGARLVGAHVLAESAGELIGELTLAIEQERSVSHLGSLVHVYPTIATSIQQLGGAAATETAVRYRWLMRATRAGRARRRRQ